jgi:hypothetical protein
MIVSELGNGTYDILTAWPKARAVNPKMKEEGSVPQSIF